MLSASLEQVVLQHFEDLGTSFSLKCAILWRYGEIEALVRQKVRPEDYETPARYFAAAQALGFVKKLRGLLDNADKRREATVAKWWEGELDCYRTNQRLYPFLPGSSVERDEALVPHFEAIRRIIGSELVGWSPPDLLVGRHGPGATFADRGVAATVPHKMSSDPTLTSGAIWLLPQFLGTAWGSYVASERKLAFVRGCRFTTVPKTSVIDRPIAVEPSINVFYQLAAGKALRSRLRRKTGWDLDHAQTIHRREAERSSVSREFATLDLSNASDTVSINLVRLVVPPRWTELLEILRSPFIRHPTDPRKWVRLEKFSSMGNGFTFELETVIFSALAIHASRLCGEAGILGYDTFVFGDDIIVKDGVVRTLKALLSYCGFTLNEDKTFFGNSPFRESCGADFYNGVDVRPSSLKEDPQNVQDAFGVANRLRAAYDRLDQIGPRCRRSAWFLAVRLIPLPYRHCRGPKGLGDTVIWDREDVWQVRWRNSIRYIRSLKAGNKVVIPYADFHPDVVVACAVYGAGNAGTPEGGRVPVVEGVYPRDCVRSHVVGWVAYS